MNAIYFKGSWDNQFEKHRTKEMPFKTSMVSVWHYQWQFLVPVLILTIEHVRSITSGAWIHMGCASTAAGLPAKAWRLSLALYHFFFLLSFSPSFVILGMELGPLAC
jgi:hypothetical protein